MDKKTEWFEDQVDYGNVDNGIHPKFSNRFTGEVLPYKTFSNVQPDKGVENTGDDLCRLEDFEPIGAVIARFLRSGGVEAVKNMEYAYSEDSMPSLDEDNAFDVVDGSDDILDQQMDLESYMDNRSAATVASDSAVQQPLTSETEKRAQQSDDVEKVSVADEA